MPKGLLSLAEVCDCPPGAERRLWLQTELKSSWRPPCVLKLQVPKNLLRTVWCSCYNMTWASQRALTLSLSLGKPFVLWVLCTFPNRYCRCNSDSKGSAGRTSLYLQSFCQKGQFWVIWARLMRLELTSPKCWCPKVSNVSKQMGVVLSYSKRKKFSSVLYTT